MLFISEYSDIFWGLWVDIGLNNNVVYQNSIRKIIDIICTIMNVYLISFLFKYKYLGNKFESLFLKYLLWLGHSHIP